MARKKLTPISSLKAKLWKLCSEYNRRKECDADGYGTCISCKKPLHWKDGQAGHFIPAARGGTSRYYDGNIFLQCRGCNCYPDESIKIRYTIEMIRRVGVEGVEEIQAMARQKAMYRRADYEEMIEQYKNLIADLD